MLTNAQPAHPLPASPLKGEEWRAQACSFTTREGQKARWEDVYRVKALWQKLVARMHLQSLPLATAQPSADQSRALAIS